MLTTTIVLITLFFIYKWSVSWIEYYNRLGSTNDEAWKLIDSGEATHGMMVITDHQFKGKGRGTNSWFMSPSKGLAMSLILMDSITIENASLVPLAAGVAVARTLENRGSSPNLKWPNDILFQQKKVGGILCESRISGQQVQAIVIGLGLNINEIETDWSEDNVNKVWYLIEKIRLDHLEFTKENQRF